MSFVSKSNRNSRKRKSLLASTSASSTNNRKPSNFLSQLETLRSFLGCSIGDENGSSNGSSSNVQFSEQDLSSCLRKCGYNVQRAAETLLTGQYQSDSNEKKNVISQKVASRSNNVTTTNTSSTCIEIDDSDDDDDNNNGNVAKEVGVVSPLLHNSPSEDNDKATSNEKKTVKSNYNNNHSKESTSKFFQPHTINITRIQNDRNKSKKRNIHKINNNHSTKIKAETCSIKHENESSKRYKSTMIGKDESSSSSMKLLLCRRWIVAFSTSRNGIIQYHECVSITSSFTSSTTVTSISKKKPCNIVRFKGDRIEGTLDTKLGNFIAPLMNYHQHSVNNEIQSPLIKFEAKGLMYDDQIRIGSEVPLEISIYITNPKVFFALFENDDPISNPDSNEAVMNNNNSAWFHNNRMKQPRDDCSTLKRAAFDLLQWANYGDVPLFESSGSDCDNIDSKENHSDNNIGHKSNTKSIHVQEEGTETNIDELSKETLLNQNNDGNVPNWAQDLFSSRQSTSSIKQKKSTPEEENDPIDLNSKGVYLRPYQRQALHWMMHRESNSNSKINSAFKEQLEFLSDLAAEASTSNGKGIGSSGSKRLKRKSQPSYLECGQGSVKCDIGPVQVSEEVASTSFTLDGMVDPVCHPLWRKRFLWDVDSDNENVYSFYVNELLHSASKTTPNPPRECCGGILADSMGLGKTVMLMSLISKDKERRLRGTEEPSSIDDENNDDEKKADVIDSNKNHMVTNDTFCTLVVTPLSLLPQWEDEITSKTSLTCNTCYGESSSRISLQSDLKNVDVLLTTYGTIQSEFSNRDKKRSSNCSILNLNFSRVILDESHLIKNPSTAVSRACCSIKAKHRWCVTGTPIINSLHDVFGLLKFLKHEPWCELSFWKNAISRAITSDGSGDEDSTVTGNEKVEKYDGMKVALRRVRRVLNPLLLRRTKDTVGNDGRSILSLPPIERKIVKVEFTNHERYFYNALLDKSQAVFEGFVAAGTASKSWFAIFSLLQRLRQACDHLSLTVKSQIQDEENEDETTKDLRVTNESIGVDKGEIKRNEQSHLNDKFLKDLFTTFSQHTNEQNMSNEQQAAANNHFNKVASSLSQCMESNTDALVDECSICLEVPRANDIAITPCSHVFCRTCLLATMKRQRKTIKKEDKSDEDYAICPFCAVKIRFSNIKFTKSIPTINEEGKLAVLTEKQEEEYDARAILEEALQGKHSSKICAVLNELDLIWKSDEKSKVIIFSQYLGMLNLVGKALNKEGITFHKLDGKMSLKDRRATLKQFNSHTIEPHGLEYQPKDSKRGSVLLASMKACGVGLNLVAASTVFIVDPWWNDAMEDQCVNRIHRIGQTASIVRMRKFIITNSVEEKIVKMQERKKGVASEVLNHQNDIGDKRSNPTLEDFKAIFGR